MQSEILLEVDNLKVEVNEGRRKINDEIERNRRLREENFDQLKNEFSVIKDKIDKEVSKILLQEENLQSREQHKC